MAVRYDLMIDDDLTEQPTQQLFREPFLRKRTKDKKLVFAIKSGVIKNREIVSWKHFRRRLLISLTGLPSCQVGRTLHIYTRELAFTHNFVRVLKYKVFYITPPSFAQIVYFVKA